MFSMFLMRSCKATTSVILKVGAPYFRSVVRDVPESTARAGRERAAEEGQDAPIRIELMRRIREAVGFPWVDLRLERLVVAPQLVDQVVGLLRRDVPIL